VFLEKITLFMERDILSRPKRFILLEKPMLFMERDILSRLVKRLVKVIRGNEELRNIKNGFLVSNLVKTIIFMVSI